MKHKAFPAGIVRDDLVTWFREGRARSKQLFSIPAASTYYERPISLRNPIVFYEGHLPAFCVNTMIKLALQRDGINSDYEVLFARGIDPDSEIGVKNAADLWPARDRVQAYGREADLLVEETLAAGTVEDESVPPLRGGEATLAILEHEQMHQETLLYMFHNLPYELKHEIRPPNSFNTDGARPAASANDLITISAGKAALGRRRGDVFGWDNEFPLITVDVPEFSIQRHNVTNGEYMDFVNAGGYRDPSLWTREAWEWIATSGIQHPRFWTHVDGNWCWRGMFRLMPLDPHCPVYVAQAEAAAYARWRGMRVPTEAEYHRAAFGTPTGEEREYPWGDALPDATRGNFDFVHWDPVPVGSYPAGASAWGVHDLVGNGWEWTSTPFGGFPGFEPMASYSVYSADFFDGQHFVLKGASPATARHLVRRSFRNWFRGTYPYVYATFRCVSGGGA